MVSTTHTKGFDSFTTSGYGTGHQWLQKALEEGGHQVHHLPNHLACEGFPFTLEELFAYDCVILSDIGANTLLLAPDTFQKSEKRPNRCDVIRDYVKQGGALIMVGGYMTFAGIEGKGKWYDTSVMEVLPVTLSPQDDRQEHSEGIVPEVVDAHPALQGLPEPWPCVLGYNKTVAKPEAEVPVKVLGDPLIAFGRYGKGKSAVFTSDCAPHWAPPEFVAWEGYAPLWCGMVSYLVKK